MSLTKEERKIYSVAELNSLARQLLEGRFGRVWVEGEISNFMRASSGHWYFSLKDERAQVRCAMFANRNRSLRFRPKDGMQVILRGKASLYEGRGDFQVIAENLMQAGEGLLQQKFEELKQQLSNEGLFSDIGKKPIPSLPRHIGVITSPSGAAIRDILSVLKRRFPAIPVTLIPTLVQGGEAADQIVSAIRLANNLPQNIAPFDVLILGRGGGSLEDLWCFNEEKVAREIYASNIPIVSAVGHEVDFTIADFVSDLRAPTPSAAAELVVPDQREWLGRLQNLESALAVRLKQNLSQKDSQLSSIQKRLRHPGRQLQDYAQRLDRIENSLLIAMDHRLQVARASTAQLHSELGRLQPTQLINGLKASSKQLEHRLLSSVKEVLQNSRHRMHTQTQKLHTLSPLKTLDRGYAIVTNEQQQILRDASQVSTGDRITTRVARGQLHCTVDEIES